jgi:hypothetical protein
MGSIDQGPTARRAKTPCSSLRVEFLVPAELFPVLRNIPNLPPHHGHLLTDMLGLRVTAKDEAGVLQLAFL